MPDEADAITATDTGDGKRLALVLSDGGLFMIEVTKDFPDAAETDESPEVEFRRIPLDRSKARVSVAEAWGPGNRPIHISNWTFDFGRCQPLEFTTHIPSDDEGDLAGFATKLAALLGKGPEEPFRSAPGDRRQALHAKVRVRAS